MIKAERKESGRDRITTVELGRVRISITHPDDLLPVGDLEQIALLLLDCSNILSDMIRKPT